MNWSKSNEERRGKKQREERGKTFVKLSPPDVLTSSLSISLLSFLGEIRASSACSGALAWNNARLEPEQQPRDGIANEDDVDDAPCLASTPASRLSASARSLVAARISAPAPAIHPRLPGARGRSNKESKE